jgi:Putative DNA-binding domain
MIPKPLNEIEWSDIEALRDSGREEDDTIEYKGSFSGGYDFLAFTDSQRVKAVEGVVREALAFLNGRGGDVLIGVREAKNDHPKIEEITPVANVVATVDRLAQSLVAVIEPTQSILGVKAVLKPGGDGDGVILVRAPSSLRAPHRYTGNKECYIRRGRESVPMPMDEVQDLTLRRADTQSERLSLLAEQFLDHATDRVGRHTLSAHRVHFRMCFVPLSRQQIVLSTDVLNAFRGGDPELILGDSQESNDVAFRYLSSWDYSPILRGMCREALQDKIWGDDDFSYAAKVVRNDGIMRTDFACRSALSERTESTNGFHVAWVAGYFANSLRSMAAVHQLLPSLGHGVLRVAVHSAGSITVATGIRHWAQHYAWPAGTVTIPDFDIADARGLDRCFEQLQIDVNSIAGVRQPAIYTLA